MTSGPPGAATGRLSFLVSFHYYRDTDIEAWMEAMGGTSRIRLFGDSGAYSAKHQGADIDIEVYAAWLERWRHLFAAYANLDVIGDDEASLRNLVHLEDRGLQPLPVFHGGEDWSYLDRYLDRYPYIALGGAVGADWRLVAAWLVQCFTRAQPHGTAFHGFGMTRWELLRDFPFYSVDSSSWGSAYRYGVVKLFDRGRWVSVHVGDKKDVLAHYNLLKRYGVAPEWLYDREKYHRRFAARLSAEAWQRATAWLRQRHGPIELPGADEGLHLYLADGSADNITAATGPLVYLAGKQEPMYHAATDESAPEYRGGYTVGRTARAASSE